VLCGCFSWFAFSVRGVNIELNFLKPLLKLLRSESVDESFRDLVLFAEDIVTGLFPGNEGGRRQGGEGGVSRVAEIYKLSISKKYMRRFLSLSTESLPICETKRRGYLYCKDQ
jgi:hypothetical protein